MFLQSLYSSLRIVCKNTTWFKRGVELIFLRMDPANIKACEALCSVPSVWECVARGESCPQLCWELSLMFFLVNGSC